MTKHQHQKTLATSAGTFCLECGEQLDKSAANNNVSQFKDSALKVASPSIVGHSKTRLKVAGPGGADATDPLLTPAPEITPKATIKRQAL